MNFLSLCQRAQKYAGIQATIQNVNLLNQDSIQQVLVNAVRDAHTDIQNLRKDFKFKRREVEITLEAGRTEYTLAQIFADPGVFGYWRVDRFIYDSSPMVYIPYDRWVLTDWSEHTADKPTYFTINPENESVIVAPVDTDYHITAFYYIGVVTLLDNTDVPILPPPFHMMIVYKAVADLSAVSGDIINYQLYSNKYDVMAGQLFRSQVPSRKVQLKPLV